MKPGRIAQFILTACGAGIVAPFFLSLCLFGSTLQVFMEGAPTPGYWSGAPTAAATAAPGQLQTVSSAALNRGGGAVFVLWSIVGALLGEALASRWPGGDPWHQTRREIMGAVAGALLFSAIAIFIFLPQGPTG